MHTYIRTHIYVKPPSFPPVSGSAPHPRQTKLLGDVPFNLFFPISKPLHRSLPHWDPSSLFPFCIFLPTLFQNDFPSSQALISSGALGTLHIYSHFLLYLLFHVYVAPAIGTLPTGHDSEGSKGDGWLKEISAS